LTRIAARALLLPLALALFVPARADAAQTSQQKNAARTMNAYQKHQKKQLKKAEKDQKKQQKKLQKLRNTGH
jgi:hypothetical protein